MGDGTAERIDAGRERAGQRTGVLPGGKGIDCVETVLKNRAGGIEEGISEGDGLRKVDIERPNEMFAVDVEVGDGDGGMVGDFAFEREAGLLHARSDEIGGKGGNVVSDALGEPSRKTASSRGYGATCQRVGIRGKDLMVVIVAVVEKKLGVGDAVVGGDGGVVYLRNANVEEAVAATDDEWSSLAEGIGKSGARAEIVRVERNFAGGWEKRVGE